MTRALREAGYGGVIRVAGQDDPTGPFDLEKLTRRLEPDQLTLI